MKKTPPNVDEAVVLTVKQHFEAATSVGGSFAFAFPIDAFSISEPETMTPDYLILSIPHEVLAAMVALSVVMLKTSNIDKMVKN